MKFEFLAIFVLFVQLLAIPKKNYSNVMITINIAPHDCKCKCTSETA